MSIRYGQGLFLLFLLMQNGVDARQPLGMRSVVGARPLRFHRRYVPPALPVHTNRVVEPVVAPIVQAPELILMQEFDQRLRSLLASSKPTVVSLVRDFFSDNPDSRYSAVNKFLLNKKLVKVRRLRDLMLFQEFNDIVHPQIAMAKKEEVAVKRASDVVEDSFESVLQRLTKPQVAQRKSFASEIYPASPAVSTVMVQTELNALVKKLAPKEQELASEKYQEDAAEHSVDESDDLFKDYDEDFVGEKKAIASLQQVLGSVTFSMQGFNYAKLQSASVANDLASVLDIESSPLWSQFLNHAGDAKILWNVLSHVAKQLHAQVLPGKSLDILVTCQQGFESSVGDKIIFVLTDPKNHAGSIKSSLAQGQFKQSFSIIISNFIRTIIYHELSTSGALALEELGFAKALSQVVADEMYLLKGSNALYQNRFADISRTLFYRKYQNEFLQMRQKGANVSKFFSELWLSVVPEHAELLKSVKSSDPLLNNISLFKQDLKHVEDMIALHKALSARSAEFFLDENHNPFNFSALRRLIQSKNLSGDYRFVFGQASKVAKVFSDTEAFIENLKSLVGQNSDLLSLLDKQKKFYSAKGIGRDLFFINPLLFEQFESMMLFERVVAGLNILDKDDSRLSEKDGENIELLVASVASAETIKRVLLKLVEGYEAFRNVATRHTKDSVLLDSATTDLIKHCVGVLGNVQHVLISIVEKVKKDSAGFAIKFFKDYKYGRVLNDFYNKVFDLKRYIQASGVADEIKIEFIELLPLPNVQDVEEYFEEDLALVENDIDLSTTFEQDWSEDYDVVDDEDDLEEYDVAGFEGQAIEEIAPEHHDDVWAPEERPALSSFPYKQKLESVAPASRRRVSFSVGSDSRTEQLDRRKPLPVAPMRLIEKSSPVVLPQSVPTIDESDAAATQRFQTKLAELTQRLLDADKAGLAVLTKELSDLKSQYNIFLASRLAATKEALLIADQRLEQGRVLQTQKHQQLVKVFEKHRAKLFQAFNDFANAFDKAMDHFKNDKKVQVVQEVCAEISNIFKTASGNFYVSMDPAVDKLKAAYELLKPQEGGGDDRINRALVNNRFFNKSVHSKYIYGFLAAFDEFEKYAKTEAVPYMSVWNTREHVVEFKDNNFKRYEDVAAFKQHFDNSLAGFKNALQQKIQTMGSLYPKMLKKDGTPNQELMRNDGESSLMFYLGAWHDQSEVIPKEILQLVELAKEKAVPIKLDWKKDKMSEPDSWIEDLFGKKEQVIVEDLKKIAGPRQWTFKDIDKAFEESMKLQAKGGQPAAVESTTQFVVVQGLDVRNLHRCPLGFGKNVVVQLASQFNYLESTSNAYTPVLMYPGDPTQGPLCAAEAAAATMHRDAAVRNNKLPNMLKDVLPKEFSGYYKNGYFEPNNIPDAKVSDVLQTIEKYLIKFKVLPHWVLNESSQNLQLHVPCAAPSFQNSIKPDFTSDKGKICNVLVTAQYERIAKIAVILSNQLGKTVNLHLTLVGQGSFKNPKEVMKDSFDAVKNIVTGKNVRVFVHGWDDDGIKIIREAGVAGKFVEGSAFENLNEAGVGQLVDFA